MEGYSPTRATLGEQTFRTFPYKTQRTVYTRGSPYFDGKVTLLVGPTFLHINIVTQLGQLSQGETIRACASAVGSSKGVSFFLIQTFAKVDSSDFSPNKRALSIGKQTKGPSLKLFKGKTSCPTTFRTRQSSQNTKISFLDSQSAIFFTSHK